MVLPGDGTFHGIVHKMIEVQPPLPWNNNNVADCREQSLAGFQLIGTGLSNWHNRKPGREAGCRTQALSSACTVRCSGSMTPEPSIMSDSGSQAVIGHLVYCTWAWLSRFPLLDDNRVDRVIGKFLSHPAWVSDSDHCSTLMHVQWDSSFAVLSEGRKSVELLISSIHKKFLWRHRLKGSVYVLSCAWNHLCNASCSCTSDTSWLAAPHRVLERNISLGVLILWLMCDLVQEEPEAAASSTCSNSRWSIWKLDQLLVGCGILFQALWGAIIFIFFKDWSHILLNFVSKK
jgi:hypothetical protein